MDDAKFLKAFLRMRELIEASPNAEHGETIVHGDGSVTEDRWKFHAAEAPQE